MFRREKKANFPFILFGLFDPEGLGAGTRRPLVLQEVAHLPLQSCKVCNLAKRKNLDFYVKNSNQISNKYNLTH
ncbi:hypothetical protein ACQCVP_09165 [Rossellomorea vietnamensis]